MTDISQTNNGDIIISVDTTIYDNWVIDKVLYWLSVDYIITRKNSPDTNIQVITLSLKGKHKQVDFNTIKEKLSNDFIDFKNRQTIARETANYSSARECTEDCQQRNPTNRKPLQGSFSFFFH